MPTKVTPPGWATPGQASEIVRPQNFREPMMLTTAHVINVAGCPDLWPKMVNQIHQELAWNLPLVRHLAMDSREWSTQADAMAMDGAFAPFIEPALLPLLARGDTTETRHLRGDAVGCGLCHMHLWSMLWAHHDWQYMLILADDAHWSLPERWTLAQFNDRVGRVKNDWDILLLGATYDQALHNYGNFVHLNDFSKTYGYIIRKSAVAKVMHNFLPMGDDLAAALSRRAKENLKVYCMSPNVFWKSPDNLSRGTSLIA